MIPATVPGAPPWQEALIERCVGGDEVAWQLLYREYQQTARRFLLRMGVEKNALDDICQEVFLQAFRYLPRFRGQCSFKTWLYKICVSEARRSRKRRQLLRLLGSLLARQDQDSLSSGELGEEYSERLVQQALSALPEKERLVFVLYELEGLPGKEIADIVDCPSNTVWRRLHYARQSFRAYVMEHGLSP